jgi:regulator of protease activity HflC (stomatin/prohibitin superfamily)
MVVLIIIFLIFLGLRIVQQYEKGIVFRFGKIVSVLKTLSEIDK